jgi:hypothetical protein
MSHETNALQVLYKRDSEIKVNGCQASPRTTTSMQIMQKSSKTATFSAVATTSYRLIFPVALSINILRKYLSTRVPMGASSYPVEDPSMVWLKGLCG